MGAQPGISMAYAKHSAAVIRERVPVQRLVFSYRLDQKHPVRSNDHLRVFERPERIPGLWGPHDKTRWRRDRATYNWQQAKDSGRAIALDPNYVMAFIDRGSVACPIHWARSYERLLRLTSHRGRWLLARWRVTLVVCNPAMNAGDECCSGCAISQ